jgi:hypothetical protein
MEDRSDLERKLEQTNRLSVFASDPTTQQRLAEFRDEVIEALKKFPNRRQHSIPAAAAACRDGGDRDAAQLDRPCERG